MPTLGVRGLQLWNNNEKRTCTTTIRMSIVDGLEQGIVLREQKIVGEAKGIATTCKSCLFSISF